MKTTIYVVLIAIAMLAIWQCTKDTPEPPELPTAGELIQKHQMGENVSVAMVNAVRQKMLDDLIKADQDGQWKTANPGGQDTTGVNTLFQTYRIPSSISSFHVAHKLIIHAGTYQPDIHSMCFIVRNSPNIEPILASIKLEEYSSYIDFPPTGAGFGTVLYNTTATGTYFVFYSLSPFQLSWVDKIILDMWYYNQAPGTDHWITIDRSDPNNFALSSDGYTDYVTYFFPDTLYLN